jgi:hypothetical protein
MSELTLNFAAGMSFITKAGRLAVLTEPTRSGTWQASVMSGDPALDGEAITVAESYLRSLVKDRHCSGCGTLLDFDDVYGIHLDRATGRPHACPVAHEYDAPV